MNGVGVARRRARRWRSVLAAAGVVGTGVVGIVPASAAPAVPGVLDPAADSWGEYTPVNPTRILDTRDGNGAVGPGGVRTIKPVASGDVPGDDVLAVVMNVTATSPTGGSFLTVYPPEHPRPNVSNLNFTAGQTVPNLVTVMVGESGTTNLYNLTGDVHVVVDVVGYYADTNGTGGGRFRGVDPSRLLDTRDGTGRPGNAAGAVPAGDITLQVAGPKVPTTASAVVLNVTAVKPTHGTYVTVYPGDLATPPTASNLNVVGGAVRANLVTVRLPASGQVKLFHHLGDIDLVADVMGYYEPADAGAGRYHPSIPYRAFDSRDEGEKLDPGSSWGFPIQADPDPSLNWVGGVVLNVTATESDAPGFLTVYPGGPTPPFASNVNFGVGETVPNHVLVRTAQPGSAYADRIHVVSPVANTHVILDVFGYFMK